MDFANSWKDAKLKNQQFALISRWQNFLNVLLHKKEDLSDARKKLKKL